MSVGAVLTCPPQQGALKRTAQAADGQSCEYAGAAGESVTLQRVALNGKDIDDALAPTEAALRPLVSPHTPGAASADGDDDDAPAASGAKPDSGWDDGDSDHAKIDLPGVHINAHGDKAEVSAFGVHVNADGPNANVDVGGGEHAATVDAGPDGAVIHARDVSGENATIALILASNRPGPSGLVAAGYLARGPVFGPLVVATFKARNGVHNDWRGDHDLKALLALNIKS